MTPDPSPCLLLIDVQRGFDEPRLGRRNNTMAEANVARLLAAWRRAGHPIVHVRHHSTDPQSPFRPDQPGAVFKWEAEPQPGEPVYTKSVNSAFIGTTLDADLRARGIGTLIIAGLTTDHCVSTTVRMAGNLGYQVWVAADACATFERRDYTGQILTAETIHQGALASLHGEFATVADTDALVAARGGADGHAS
jgi:nicotinamidase-related amidase